MRDAKILNFYPGFLDTSPIDEVGWEVIFEYNGKIYDVRVIKPHRKSKS